MAREILGYKVERIPATNDAYPIWFLLHGKRITYKMVKIGKNFFQPINSRGNFCAIKGNRVFTIKAGELTVDTGA